MVWNENNELSESTGCIDNPEGKNDEMGKDVEYIWWMEGTSVYETIWYKKFGGKIQTSAQRWNYVQYRLPQIKNKKHR